MEIFQKCRVTNFTQTPKKNKNEVWNFHLAMLGRVAKPIFTSQCPSAFKSMSLLGFKKWNRLRTFPNPSPQNATGVQPSAFGGFGTHAPRTTIQSVVSSLHLQRELAQMDMEKPPA